MSQLTDKELQDLTNKWLSGTITCQEQKILDEWYDRDVPESLEWARADEDENHLRDRIFGEIKEVQRKSYWRCKVTGLSIGPPQLAAAAAILLTFIGGICYFTKTTKKAGVTTVAVSIQKPHIRKAMLTLADGSKVLLDEAQKGLIAKQGSAKVNKTGGGELSYSNDGHAVVPDEFNTMSTPAGSQYEVTLSDGTKVWLNAMSTIKYPAAFGKGQRLVELNGEAYFEVAKDKARPFRVVLSNHRSVQVLGTHFNIMAYADENDIDATLLEGSIKASDGAEDRIITPGQQARISDKIKVVNVNAEEAIAWKKGLFSFDRSDTQMIMHQISRWYNVSVVYRGKVPSNQLTGYISRETGLTEVLKMLDISGIKTILTNDQITIIN